MQVLQFPCLFNPNGVQFQVGDGVIVETTRGTEYAQCVRGNNLIDEIELTAPLRPVVRRATPEDQKQVERNKEREKHVRPYSRPGRLPAEDCRARAGHEAG